MRGEFSNQAASSALDEQAADAQQVLEQALRNGDAQPIGGRPYWAQPDTPTIRMGVSGGAGADDSTELDRWAPTATNPAVQPGLGMRVKQGVGVGLKAIAGGVGKGLRIAEGLRWKHVSGETDIQFIYDKLGIDLRPFADDLARGESILDEDNVEMRRPLPQEMEEARKTLDNNVRVILVWENGQRFYRGENGDMYVRTQDGSMMVLDTKNRKWNPITPDEIRKKQLRPPDPNDASTVGAYHTGATGVPTKGGDTRDGFINTSDVRYGDQYPTPPPTVYDSTIPSGGDGQANVLSAAAERLDVDDYVQHGVLEPFRDASREETHQIDSLFDVLNNPQAFSEVLYGFNNENVQPIELMRKAIANFASDKRDLSRAYLYRLRRFINQFDVDNNAAINDVIGVLPLVVLAPNEGSFQTYCQERYHIELSDRAVSNLNNVRKMMRQKEQSSDFLSWLHELDEKLQKQGRSLSPQP